jgi:fibronectin type 3 domain-containing protein
MRGLRETLFVASLTAMLWTGCSGDRPLSTPDTVPPATPTGLHVVRPGDGEVPLSWEANAEPDLAGYKVYCSEDSGRTYAFESDVSTSSYLDVGLSYETAYYYVVSAFDRDENQSGCCAPVSAIPRNTSPPLPPQDLKAIAHNLQIRRVLEVALTWAPNKESDLLGYKVYRSLTGGFRPSAESFLLGTTEVQYVDKDVEVGKRYHYLVTAYDKEPLESAASNDASDIPLATPALVLPQNGATTHTTPTFEWEAVYAAASYKVILTTSLEAGEIWMGSTADTHLLYSGEPPLVSGTTYYWKVGTVTNLPDDLNSISDVWRFTPW